MNKNMKKILAVALLVGTLISPFSAHAALIDGLVAYWKFDESSGNAEDIHAANDLTNNNTTPYGAAIINNGADLEAGSSQYFSRADTADLSFTGDMSWSWWMKPESEAGDPVIILKWGAAGQRAYYVQTRFSVNRIRLGTSAGGTTLNEGDVEVPAFTVDGTVWYHMCLSYTASAGAYTVYVNGVDEGTDSTVDTSLADGNSAFAISSYEEGGGRGNYFDGMIDEMGAFDVALTGANCASLYNAGAGLAYPLAEAGGGGGLIQDLILFE